MFLKLFFLLVVAQLQFFLSSGFVVAHENDIPKIKKGWSVLLADNLENLEYSQYLNDVFQVLQGAGDFYKKLQKEYSTEGLAKGVESADNLDFHVPPDIRSKLDELKRTEIQRLVKYATDLKKLENVEDTQLIGEMKTKMSHLDMKDTNSFGPSDLRRLINETARHLDVMEHFRKVSFKHYEMHKHLEMEELLKRESPERREFLLKNLDELIKYHRRAKPMYVPMSKPHLIEVWEEMDHMNRENFNTRTFFIRHDLDGNELLDEYEITILLKQEVDRYYNSSEDDYDPKEKEAEVESMLHFVFTSVDTNKDRLIEMEEFIDHTKLKDMTDVEFWESIGNKPVFTEEEYKAYAEEHRKEINQMIDEGLIKLPESGRVPPP